MTDLSLVIPILDEVESLSPLLAEIREALDPSRRAYEVILVDDGSTDGSRDLIRRLCSGDPRLRGLLLDGHHGQTAAFYAGFSRARAGIVVTMDADLQNDPRDVPALLAALEGHDMAIGVRVRRHDSPVRRLSSRVARAVRSWVLGDDIADIGCSLKAYRRPVLKVLPPFSGMHRFLPILARMHGFSVVEVPVSHRPRRAGRSKYGIANRVVVAFADLLAVRWMKSRRLRHRIAEDCSCVAIAEEISAEIR